MTAAKPGHSQGHRRANGPRQKGNAEGGKATNSCTTPPPKPAKPLTTHQFYDGNTSIRGNSSASGYRGLRLTDPDTVVRRRLKTPALFARRWPASRGRKLSDCAAMAQGQVGSQARGGVPAHDRTGPEQSPADVYCQSGRGRVSEPMTAGKTWRAPSTKGLRSQYIPDPTAEIATASTASRWPTVAAGCAVHAEALGRDGHATTPASCARDQRKPAPPISGFRD